MTFFPRSGSKVFETLSLVVSISGFDEPKLESVTIPTAFPVRVTDFSFRSDNACETISIDSLSPNDIR